ncbi:hypothetical protein BRDID11002_67200 [Bradyrhizobium diazoefficiens]
MNQTPRDGWTTPEAGESEAAPITVMLSSRLMVLANLLKRGAILRYKRLAGLSLGRVRSWSPRSAGGRR